MAELTGLESILSRSHFNTQRRNKFSFGKSQRFSPLKSNYTIDFYDLSSPRDTRTCSFGYGNKYFYNNRSNNPSASQYSLPAEKKAGISFGTGREKLKAGDYLDVSLLNKSPPSNTYKPNYESISKFANSSKYSMRKKTTSDSFIKVNPNPEPSKYNVDLEKNGRLTLSTFKTPKKTVFPKSSRFLSSLCTVKVYLENDLIGPGQYNAKEEISSKRASSRKNIFSRAAKTTFTAQMAKKSKDLSPGPIYYIP